MTLNQSVSDLTPDENTHSQISAAPGAAVSLAEASFDADLQALIDTWPTLVESMKAKGVKLVRSAAE